MELLNLRLGGTEKERERRQNRLIGIRQSIEAGMRFEEEALSRPLDPTTLKRVYNLDSLWIIENNEKKKLGSANYERELELFKSLRQEYNNLTAIKIHRGGVRYYVLELGPRYYAFSTPLDLTEEEIYLMLRQIEASLMKKLF